MVMRGTSIMSLARDIKSASTRDREKALTDLISVLRSSSRNLCLDELSDKSYHELFEALFSLVLREKPHLYDKKKAASTSIRLNKCATAIRVAVNRGLTKFGRKTLLALTDHITQVVQGPHGEHVDSLLTEYVKALNELLSYPPHIELLARREGSAWDACVDFLLDVAFQSRLLGALPASVSSVRGSPGPGPLNARASAPIVASSAIASVSKREPVLDGGLLKDVLTGLGHCIKAGNAPVRRRFLDVADVATRVLRFRMLSLGSLQTLAFALINSIFDTVHAEEHDFALNLVKVAIPLMSYWWKPEKVSQDELIRGLRNEISKGIILMHNHLEHLVVRQKEPQVQNDVVDLVETIWSEYSKRGDPHRLQLHDVDFLPSPHRRTDSFALPLFCLRPHNIEGESFWVILVNIARMESLLLRVERRFSTYDETSDTEFRQSNKRRKVQDNASRVLRKLNARETRTRQTAMQVLSFMIDLGFMSTADLSDTLVAASSLVGDRDHSLASWALVACTSCALTTLIPNDCQETWKHLWYQAVRLMTLPSACRTACLLLHALLSSHLVDYASGAAEVNSIVTSADISGPCILCDTSISLMLFLCQARNRRLPSAVQTTSNHVIRWAFMRWNPSDKSYASTQVDNIQVVSFVNLLRYCTGSPSMFEPCQPRPTGGALLEAWKSHVKDSEYDRYLLLLEDEHNPEISTAAMIGTVASQQTPSANPLTFQIGKKFVLDLLYSRLQELHELCRSWSLGFSEGGVQISLERYQSVLHACLTGALLLPLFEELNSPHRTPLHEKLEAVVLQSLSAALSSVEPIAFIEKTLRLTAACMPSLSSFPSLKGSEPGLFRILTQVASITHTHTLQHQSQHKPEGPTDTEEDIDSQTSHATLPKGIPRFDMQISLHPRVFNLESTKRLTLLQTLNTNDVNLSAHILITDLLALEDSEFLLCRKFLIDFLKCGMPIKVEDAMNVVERLGTIVSSSQFQCCEVALATCMDVIKDLCDIWMEEDSLLAEPIGDLYHHLVKSCLPSNIFSFRAQASLAELLFKLLKTNPDYATELGLESCRTSFLGLLREGPMRVKYLIAKMLPEVFELYVLMLHDDIFLDVLESLPADPEHISGIAFRLLVLSKLARRWPTLLRRCVYHIFETPGKVSQASAHGQRCVSDISQALRLQSPRELFMLFSRQLLFTWLESDSIEDIPYAVFDFSCLDDLLRATQAEMTALLMMRQQHDALTALAKRLDCPEHELLRQNFAVVLAFVTTSGVSRSSQSAGEDELRRRMGTRAFNEARRENLTDTIALLLDTIDQEDDVVKVLSKYPELGFAMDSFNAIKAFAHSESKLPPNQQPMARAKTVIYELFRVCKYMEMQLPELWTPALVMMVVRRLLNTVHPALGSLHACSVLRKVRILICLAGPGAYDTRVLEMLLSSLRGFVVDPECADDALGISHYLLHNGQDYLKQTPSFLAGYALSNLASLRVFLESSQSSTTQESQFKATMSKAQTFHNWLRQYLAAYESTQFCSTAQALAFHSITEAAAQIRSSGNAERGTAESKLLLAILDDEANKDHLLDGASRRVAMSLLCGDFAVPEGRREDIVGSGSEATQRAASVWKSCQAPTLSDDYLSWAGRVLGRAFSASGSIPDNVLRENRLSQYAQLTPCGNGSGSALLKLLQDMTLRTSSVEAGLAEAALRTVVSQATLQHDEQLLAMCQQTLTGSAFAASQWGEYLPPAAERIQVSRDLNRIASPLLDIEMADFPRALCLYLVQHQRESTLLTMLALILDQVTGFAEAAFPFIIHSVLLFELDRQQRLRQRISDWVRAWLTINTAAAHRNQKLLLNALLYLRTQEYPREKSTADRLHWLDIDFAAAAEAASWCSMPKTALLLAEVASAFATGRVRTSDTIDGSRFNEMLLKVYEDIDDPDAYYGVHQDPSLTSVLARAEYEREGTKTLAFRGAQYDSHIRHRDPSQESDSLALMSTLDLLGQSGLSGALLQAQQNESHVETPLENTFQTARRLEQWNLPAPAENSHHAVVLFKAYQSMHSATEVSVIQNVIHEGFGRLMRSMAESGSSASPLRKCLAALASLCELDDLLNAQDSTELESLMHDFEQRCLWMRSGEYDSVSQVLSCRGTTMSMLSQHPHLLKQSKIPAASLRQLEVKMLVLAAGVYRHHQATQESLAISTSLTHLIPRCESLHVHVDAAVRIEAASALWDQGEMSTSIKMLQNVNQDTALQRQSIPVSRADLLSTIGHKVSIARFEKPQDIQKKYLEPALRELKGRAEGRDAGSVFHQFAVFCDDQLQDPDSREDLQRLRSLRQGKSEEVAGLKALISETRDSQAKNRYNHTLTKEKQWLELDEQELRRVENAREEFVKLSLENYLRSLIASDEHNSDALRFTALWLERSEEDGTNKAVSRYLPRVPTRKFAALMNQLTSRLQDQDILFQRLLSDLVYGICLDHPYHGMYQIWSGTKAKIQSKDEIATLRVRATDKVTQRITATKAIAGIWTSIEKASKYYHLLAMEKNQSRYKSGAKIVAKESVAARNLDSCFTRFRIPPPTMQVEISANKNYTNVPYTINLEPTFSIASGVSAPKIITAVGSDGAKYRQLVKGGHDDLRQDAIMEQVFAAVSNLLRLHRNTRQRALGIRTYKVLPLTATSGIIEFVPDTTPLHEFLMPAHERYHPLDLKGTICRKKIYEVQNKSVETRITTYRKVTENFHPVMRYFFIENFEDPDEWFIRRLAYTRSTAAISMLGHILGLGDRHGHNILLDKKTGEVVHIDLGVAFEAGRILPVPELVPFRLTRDIIDGMGITKTEGVFRRCCEFTLDALREEQYSIMTILDVLRYDPLYSWSVSPLRVARLQKARHADEAGHLDDTEQSEIDRQARKRKKVDRLNEPSEADRALEVVRKKLSKTLSVTATVNDLINQATDERNLAVLYSGWAAYA